MNLKCKNNCKIKGLEENVRQLYIDFSQKGYDMNKFIPLKDKNDICERAEMWGTGTDIELECSIFNNERPVEINISLLSDGPIEQFWRHISFMYKVEIEYAFYNSEIEFIGVHTYDKGILRTCEYEEDPKSSEYKQLVKKGGFFLPEKKRAVIISFEDLVKRGNNND